MGAKLRREENALSISGMAIMVFGLWNLAQVVIDMFLNRDSVMGMSLDGQDQEAYIIMEIILVVFEVIDLGLRAFIGLTARSFGRGKDKGIAFLIIAGILVVFNICSLVSELLSLLDIETGIATNIVEIMVEATSLFAMIRVMVAGIRVRIYRKAQ